MRRIAGIALQSAATLIVVSVIMFVLLYVSPNPLEQLRHDPQYSPADIERIADQNGWNDPWYQQYASWLSSIAHGDWGESIREQRPARDVIAERLPLTLLLTGIAELVSLMIAIPLGVVLALRRDSRLDRSFAVGSFLMMATPGFVVAIALQLLAVKMYHSSGHLVFPTAGMALEGGLGDFLLRLVLPVTVLVVTQVAAWNRFQRSEMLRTLESEYVQTARAKGLTPRRVYARHALPNTMLPMVTLVAMDVGGLLGGAIVVEAIFGLPGTGMLLLESVQAHDVVVVLDLVMLGSLAIVLANAIADALYGRFDSRTRGRS